MYRKLSLSMKFSNNWNRLLMVGKLSNTQLNFNHSWLIWLSALWCQFSNFLGDGLCTNREGGTGCWVHSAGQNSMAFLGLAVEKKPWLVVGGPFSLSLREWAQKTVLCPCRAPFSGSEVFFFSVQMSNLFLKAMTISLLMSGCGLNRNSAQKGCKGTCVKFGLRNQGELDIQYI